MSFFGTGGQVARLLLRTRRHEASAKRVQPERVVLGVQDGLVPSGKPPVRMFLGTEPAQYRAERVFIWSVEQHRDPSRVYEIYLMKELVGFDRRGWLTGFTNYRFAIPHFAGAIGRAIYNDVDQLYLADPGALFDADLGKHGFLALSDRDTSVMLIDCARMASVWTLDAAQRERRKFLEARARAVSGLCGRLDPAWHARDAEYVPGRSNLLHYTAIHMQPWRPTPKRYAYQQNPVEHVWFDQERAADAAGYQVFSVARPSARHRTLLAQLRKAGGQMNENGRSARPEMGLEINALQELIASFETRTLLDYRLLTEDRITAALHARLARKSELRITSTDLATSAWPERPGEQFDGVRCNGVLEYVADEDVPWLIEALFGNAKQFVYVMVTDYPQALMLSDGTRLSAHLYDPSWWVAHFEAAGRRHPDIYWKLVVQTRTVWRRKVVHVHEGRRRLRGTPTVWVLTDGHSGNTSQSIGLVQALNLPYDVKDLQFTSLLHAHDVLFGTFGASRLGLNKTRSAPLTPPWPDLVITTGWRTAHVARWVRKRSRGVTRLIQLGRRGGHAATFFDAVVSCAYFHLPPHPRRIETVVPLNGISAERLAKAAEPWRERFDSAPCPRIALLVGGTSSLYHFDAETAQRMGEAVRDMAQAVGGSVLVTTSRRTGSANVEALRRGLGDVFYIHQWQPGQQDNPYLAYLALADVLVVTGDSESMLAEAVSTGKPVYIYPLPQGQPSLRTRLRRWVFTQARKASLNQRGTIRHQRGLAYLCARLIERGRVVPPHDLDALHQTLVRRGMARFFGEPLDTKARPAWREVDEVVRRVRDLVGIENGRDT